MQDERPPRSIAVIGGGAWGSALAVHLGRSGHAVRLWMRDPEPVARLLERRDNPAYLPGVPIPEAVVPCSELARAVDGAELLLAAVPSPFARRVYAELAPQLASRTPLVVAIKGIELETLALPLEVARDAGAIPRRSSWRPSPPSWPRACSACSPRER